jgi:hypothetical protein
MGRRLDMSKRPETPTLGSRGGTMGRPRRLIPPEAADVLERGGAAGASLVGISRALGVGADLLRAWLDEDEDLREAFARGRERERQMLHGSLVKLAQAGNVVASIFLLKARHGYREGDQSDTANRVSITFNLPGAATPATYNINDNRSDQPVGLPKARPAHS